MTSVILHSEGRLELAMKTFDDTVCDRVIGHRTEVFAP